MRQLEKIQYRAARAVPKDWASDYNTLLNQLQLTLLYTRHTYHRNIMLYKILWNQIDISFKQFFSFSPKTIIRLSNNLYL